MGTIYIIFLSILLIVGGFNGLVKSSKIHDLQEQIIYKDAYISDMKSDINVALKLLKIQTWYVVNENKVSSLPNGQGEVVDFFNRPLSPIGNRLGIRHPVFNTKIRFSPSESTGQAYTVVGGLLTYEYLDE